MDPPHVITARNRLHPKYSSGDAMKAALSLDSTPDPGDAKDTVQQKPPTSLPAGPPGTTNEALQRVAEKKRILALARQGVVAPVDEEAPIAGGAGVDSNTSSGATDSKAPTAPAKGPEPTASHAQTVEPPPDTTNSKDQAETTLTSQEIQRRVAEKKKLLEQARLLSAQ